MPVRLHVIALLSAPALVLVGCATVPAAPQAEVAAHPAAAKQVIITLAPAKPHPKRQDVRCRVAKVDLPADRVAELFRQFHVEEAGADNEVGPAAAPACRSTAR